jgi:hypothetical protein
MCAALSNIEFFGITIDSILMQARLSPAKLASTLELVRQALARPSISRCHIERLNGRLNWICKVVYGGRTFLRRLSDAQWSVSRPHHHIRLSASLRADLQWWHDFLPVFNGQTDLIPGRPLSLNDFSTDASPSYGYGAFILGGYFSLFFSQAAALFSDVPAPSAPIHLHELYAVLLVARLYSTALRGQHVRIHIDNTIVVSAVNTRTARDRTGPAMMIYLRELFWLSANHNFRLTSTYINTKNNVLSDSLSRGDFLAFSSTLAAWKEGRHTLLRS